MASRIQFDPDAMQVEVTCLDSSTQCQTFAEEVRTEVNEALQELKENHPYSPQYYGRMRVQVLFKRYWNPMNLLIFPMFVGVPVDYRSAEVQVEVESAGRRYHGEGSGGCFSSLLARRGGDGSSGCATGEGIAEALNNALASMTDKVRRAE